MLDRFRKRFPASRPVEMQQSKRKLLNGISMFKSFVESVVPAKLATGGLRRTISFAS